MEHFIYVLISRVNSSMRKMRQTFLLTVLMILYSTSIGCQNKRIPTHPSIQSLMQILKEINYKYIEIMGIIKRKLSSKQIKHAQVCIRKKSAGISGMRTGACSICLPTFLRLIKSILATYSQLISLRIWTNDCIVGCVGMRSF